MPRKYLVLQGDPPIKTHFLDDLKREIGENFKEYEFDYIGMRDEEIVLFYSWIDKTKTIAIELFEDDHDRFCGIFAASNNANTVEEIVGELSGILDIFDIDELENALEKNPKLIAALILYYTKSTKDRIRKRIVAMLESNDIETRACAARAMAVIPDPTYLRLAENIVSNDNSEEVIDWAQRAINGYHRRGIF